MPKDSSQLKLSILILSIPSRLEKYTKLQDKLLAQIGDREDVEVLCMIDNKSFHIYEKRNVLLQAARGSHLAWLDDDDDVADNYIEKLTAVIEEDPSWDVISFNQDTYLDGKHAKIYCEMGNPHDPVRVDAMETTRTLFVLPIIGVCGEQNWHSLSLSEVLTHKQDSRVKI
jgi:hypothetical protein